MKRADLQHHGQFHFIGCFARASHGHHLFPAVAEDGTGFSLFGVGGDDHDLVILLVVGHQGKSQQAAVYDLQIFRDLVVGFQIFGKVCPQPFIMEHQVPHAYQCNTF